METQNLNGACLLIYGGGLCDCANEFMRRFMQRIKFTGLFKESYVGLFSFESLVDTQFIRKWDAEIQEHAENSFGGFFGTNRDVNLVDPKLRKKAIQNLKERDIKWVFVAGGDGSARQTAEIADAFHKEGINFCFVMPCTLDGIEGGKSIGLNQAVKVSLKAIKCLASTCLMTREKYKYPILVVELQGRNRDDVLANVLKKLDKIITNPDWVEGDLGFTVPKIYVVPANYSWTREALSQCVNSTSEPTLVLISEGASYIDEDGKKKKQKRSDLGELFDRKTRNFKVGHLSQVNDCTDEADRNDISKMVNSAVRLIREKIQTDDEPFSLVYDFDGNTIVESIDYYAKLNPRENQHPTLDSSLELLIQNYIAKS